MKIFLIRVGADQSTGGGSWNAPVDAATGRFVYVPIPERKPVRSELERPYAALAPYLASLGTTLPEHLARDRMHLDPDFEHSTYGDTGSKGAQLARDLKPGDRLLFYSGLKDIRSCKLIYGLIGTILVRRLDRAVTWSPEIFDRNAHSRRELAADAPDVIAVGDPSGSGRLTRCVPIGEYRNRAYRLTPAILESWGPLSCQDGYLQRSAVIPTILEPRRFHAWWDRQDTELLHVNNTSS